MRVAADEHLRLVARHRGVANRIDLIGTRLIHRRSPRPASARYFTISVLSAPNPSRRCAAPHRRCAFAQQCGGSAERFGQAQCDPQILRHQAEREAGVELAGQDKCRILLFGGGIAPGGVIQNLQHDRRIDAELLAGQHRLRGGRQCHRRQVVVECLHRMPGAGGPGAETPGRAGPECSGSVRWRRTHRRP